MHNYPIYGAYKCHRKGCCYDALREGGRNQTQNDLKMMADGPGKSQRIHVDKPTPHPPGETFWLDLRPFSGFTFQVNVERGSGGYPAAEVIWLGLVP